MKAKQIRARAWDALKGKYWWAVLAALLAWLFGVISLGTTTSATTQAQQAADKTEEALNGLPTGAIVTIFVILISILLIAIAMSVISGAIKLGYARFNMNLFTEEEKPSMNLLFSRFNIIWKAFGLQVVKGLLVAVATCLLVVPGIIVGLGLAECEYIFAENPDLKIGEVLKRSWELMKGQKWRFFCLALSFFGWDILAGLIPAGPLLLTPYMEAAEAAFYLDLTGRLDENKDAEAVAAEA